MKETDTASGSAEGSLWAMGLLITFLEDQGAIPTGTMKAMLNSLAASLLDQETIGLHAAEFLRDLAARLRDDPQPDPPATDARPDRLRETLRLIRGGAK
jgi:hypothetical protein